jgi:large subunit ribosomal protein L30
MASRKKQPSTLKVQYYRSAIGLNRNQKRVVQGLGLRRLNSVRELKDTPEVRGMIAKVPHLVRVVE